MSLSTCPRRYRIRCPQRHTTLRGLRPSLGLESGVTGSAPAACSVDWWGSCLVHLSHLLRWVVWLIAFTIHACSTASKSGVTRAAQTIGNTRVYRRVAWRMSGPWAAPVRHGVRVCVCARVCACVRVCVRACVRVRIGAGEGTPYNIQMAACVSGSGPEWALGLFGNGVTLFLNPNRQ